MINGYRILQVRHLLKLSQKDLAAKMGIQPGELARLESCSGLPGTAMISAILPAFRLPRLASIPTSRAPSIVALKIA